MLVLWYRRIIVGGVVALLIISAGISAGRIKLAQTVTASAKLRPVIVIDAGHGGLDGGAVGITGAVEKDINLNIALMLQDMLLQSGFEVVMTRDTDISIHDKDITGTRKQKSSDLHNRLKIINKQQNSIAISIHQNKFTEQSAKGLQVFYSTNNPESEKIAAAIQANIAANLQPDNKRVIKKAQKNLFILFEAKVPAVMVECGFLSNKQEELKLSQQEYQQQIAQSIHQAIVQYLE